MIGIERFIPYLLEEILLLLVLIFVVTISVKYIKLKLNLVPTKQIIRTLIPAFLTLLCLLVASIVLYKLHYNKLETFFVETLFLLFMVSLSFIIFIIVTHIKIKIKLKTDTQIIKTLIPAFLTLLALLVAVMVFSQGYHDNAKIRYVDKVEQELKNVSAFTGYNSSGQLCNKTREYLEYLKKQNLNLSVELNQTEFYCDKIDDIDKKRGKQIKNHKRSIFRIFILFFLCLVFLLLENNLKTPKCLLILFYTILLYSVFILGFVVYFQLIVYF